jgi:predicted MFS family arabinose efflux permease
MLVALTVGSHVGTAQGQILIMELTVLGMCFTWPTLEALVSEGEPRAGLQQMVGIYNVVWAGTAAVANFLGGAMLDTLGLRSLFYVPAAILLGQLALTFWLESKANGRRASRLPEAGFSPETHARMAASRAEGPATSQTPMATVATLAPAVVRTVEAAPPPPAKARKFVRMAWLANPFSYIALQTLIAAMPGVAQRMQLSTTLAGFCGSVWGFSRLGAFLGLWLWDDWHYRFRWLLAAYLALVASFTAILLAPNVAILVLAQLFFGAAIGLAYYSSLFYSMDNSDTKGEHGGIHESVIGLGNCVGPAVGASALHFLPQYANSGALAVSLLLLCGLGGLVTIWRKG